MTAPPSRRPGRAPGSIFVTTLPAAPQAGQDAARCFRDDVLRLQREAMAPKSEDGAAAAEGAPSEVVSCP